MPTNFWISSFETPFDSFAHFILVIHVSIFCDTH